MAPRTRLAIDALAPLLRGEANSVARQQRDQRHADQRHPQPRVHHVPVPSLVILHLSSVISPSMILDQPDGPQCVDGGHRYHPVNQCDAAVRQERRLERHARQ